MSVPLRPPIALAVAAFILLVASLSLIGNAQTLQKLSRKEVKALISTAKTPSDHERLAAYYRAEAESLTAEQREHEEELKAYDENSSRYPSKYPTMGDHCRDLAGYFKMAAQKALIMADMHAQMAKALHGSLASPK